ncbi:hypothetical protein D5086_022954 [Populus alba]|uniref:Uncharacterized protein n=1 Tax=Populus alba TaxID=43335 RepID=A0ACC4B8F4_POPAL
MQHDGLGGCYSSRDDDQRIKVRALPADGNKDSVGSSNVLLIHFVVPVNDAPDWKVNEAVLGLSLMISATLF